MDSKELHFKLKPNLRGKMAEACLEYVKKGGVTKIQTCSSMHHLHHLRLAIEKIICIQHVNFFNYVFIQVPSSFLLTCFLFFLFPGLWISYSYAIFWSETSNRSCTQHKSSHHWCFQCWICSGCVYSCLSPKCSLNMDLCCFTCAK